MKLSPAQFATLHTLAEYGPKEAIEVRMTASMDGRRKVKLEWNVASGVALATLEDAGLVYVLRKEMPRPVNAVGVAGLPRRALTISISDAGRDALGKI